MKKINQQAALGEVVTYALRTNLPEVEKHMNHFMLYLKNNDVNLASGIAALHESMKLALGMLMELSAAEDKKPKIILATDAN